MDLTHREMTTLTDDSGIVTAAGSKFQSFILLRVLTLQLVRQKYETLLAQLVELPEDRSVEMEVPERLKIQKIDRLRAIHASLTALYFGTPLVQPEPTQVKIKVSILREKSIVVYQNGRYVAQPPDTAVGQLSSFADSHLRDLRNQDILYVLRDYTDTTKKVVSEAVSLRAPIMTRDGTLMDNGFFKKARKQFLDLRALCLTASQKNVLEEKEQKKQKKIKLAQQKDRKKKNAELKAILKLRDQKLLKKKSRPATTVFHDEALPSNDSVENDDDLDSIFDDGNDGAGDEMIQIDLQEVTMHIFILSSPLLSSPLLSSPLLSNAYPILSYLILSNAYPIHACPNSAP